MLEESDLIKEIKIFIGAQHSNNNSIINSLIELCIDLRLFKLTERKFMKDIYFKTL